MSLVQNKSDLYLHATKIKKWDICAPDAILNSLGGKLTSRKGKRIDYSNDNEPVYVDGIVAALHNFDFYLNLFKTS